MIARLVLFFLLTATAELPAGAQVRWSFNLNGGIPVNIPMPLHITQSGSPDISLAARYNSEPFIRPYYWMWKFSRMNDNKGWEFEAIHHKLILENVNDEVQWFAITHGLNLLYINRCHETRWFTWRYGGGVILAHPESKIRDRQFNEESGIFGMGYFIAGPAVNLSMNKDFFLTKRFFTNVEFKTTGGVAFVPVANGRAVAGHMSFHLLFGIGYDFIKH